MVQLTEAVIPSAHQGQNLTCVGIKCHQPHLRVWPRLHLGFDLFPHLDALRAQLRHLLVHQLHAYFHGLGGGFLQVGIQRRINPVGLIVHLTLIQFADQCLADQVYKVRRVTGLHIGRRQLQRRGLRLLRLRLRDGMSVHHTVQHQVAAFEGPLRMPVG